MSIKELSKYERIWLFSFTLTILSMTIIFSAANTDFASAHSVILNWIISPVSALSGILCAILAAKGKIANYAWGLVYVILYAYIAYMGGYYGDVINTVWIVPMRIIGFLSWKKMLKQGSKTDVKMKRMTPKQIAATLAAGVLATVLFGLLLENVDYWFTNVMQRNQSIYRYFESAFGLQYIGSMIDASTEVLQITASILLVFAFAEQWLFWTINNVISIAMWIVVIVAEPASISWALPTLIMWVAYLVNSLYGYTVWLKESKGSVAA